jgi:inosine-uridine nucleoside N-ribohydrolase
MKILRFFSALAVAVLAIGSAAAAFGQTAAHAEQATAPQLAILDTDIGDDIDDAFALALALKSPELHLLGITTAYGDTELRAKLLDRFLLADCAGGFPGGGGIPVIPGVATPHTNVFTQAAYARGEPAGKEPSCFFAELIDQEEEARCARERKHHDAAGYMLRQIKAHPGEITLIAIGPLNNIEAAIKKDPDTFRKLKRVVMMGGSIYRGYGEGRPPDAEWNISRDPAGLRALLASGVPVFMMPLDSTQIHLETKEREQIFAHGSPLTDQLIFAHGSPLIDQLTLLYHQWSANADSHPTTPTLFDPVAVTYAIRPDLCPATPLRLEVDDKGFTRPVAGAPNAQVCLKSDEKVFLELLLVRLTKDEGR